MNYEQENDKYVFPGSRFTQNGHVSGQGQGIAIRDWFAGQWIASGQHDNMTPSDAAEWAYSLADAMLQERQRPPIAYRCDCGARIPADAVLTADDPLCPGQDVGQCPECERAESMNQEAAE